MTNEEYRSQQESTLNFDRLADLVLEEVMSAWDIMFWRATSNPQSGDKNDYSNETYTL